VVQFFGIKKILLVREIVDQCWTMPGGWADVGETPSQSVEREVLEESGLVVQAINIIRIYDANRSNEIPLTVFHAYKIIFLCEILGGNIAPGAETSEVRFFSNEEIPKELSYKRSEMRHIEAAFKAVGDPCYLPEFD
jgi:ADP-ribose pyrophosphatase YjhB (NUDIX family)